MNKTNRTSRATSNTYNSNFNAGKPRWIEASSSEEEGVVILKGRRKLMLRIKLRKLKEN